jgi:peptidoglycan hydrolase CwlO-like protein
MTHHLIILAQSVTGAVLTIVALLLVAALIGYLTAWYYAKSVYTPIIKGLEAEKADLQKQVADLKENVSKLNSKIDELNSKNGKLEQEISQKNQEIGELRKKIKE